MEDLFQKYPPEKYSYDYNILANFLNKYKNTVGKKHIKTNIEKWENGMETWKDYVIGLNEEISRYLDEALPFYHYKQDWKRKGINVPRHPRALTKHLHAKIIKQFIDAHNYVWESDLKEIEMKGISFNAIWNHPKTPLKNFF